MQSLINLNEIIKVKSPWKTTTTGKQTECTKITPCSSNPCQNDGTCDVSGTSYICNCRWGYSGSKCEFDSECTYRQKNIVKNVTVGITCYRKG